MKTNLAQTKLAQLLLVMTTLICGMFNFNAFAEASIKTTEIRDNLYMMEGVNGFVGGNVAAFVGKDGVLLVDSLLNGRTSQLNKELKKLGANQGRYLLNTHWHGDHTGGNAVLSKDMAIVAHDNVRKYMQRDNKNFFGESKAAPKEAWPVVTFDSTMSLYFNDDKVKLIHFPNGHTNGDAMVYFKKANVLHMGDTYFKGTFPFVDLSTGGNAVGLLANISAVIEMMPEDVLIIPGHGSLSNMTELRDYRNMIQASVDMVRAELKSGKTLKQVQKKGLGKEMEKWGKGFISEVNWIDFIYGSIEQRQGKGTTHSHAHHVHHH